MDTNLLYKVMIPAGFFVYFYILFFKTPAFNDSKGLATKLAKKNEKSWRAVQRAAGIICGVSGALTLAVNFTLPAVMGEENLTAYWLGIGFEVLCLALLLPLTNVLAKKLLKK